MSIDDDGFGLESINRLKYLLQAVDGELYQLVALRINNEAFLHLFLSRINKHSNFLWKSFRQFEQTFNHPTI
ncbi:CLUMA_CG021519, isoform A [Clunio marinus]|uniref:CLUMA_CG021519, isoform A n=1 Tax=Clunio marinus TaxID=568069 RepID=A0A1J1J7D8_9DIPT|nr:CLUMA_CG021519, isoform A [Clunio marinus]